MRCLIIVEQENGLLNRPSLATVHAAKQISSDIDMLAFDSTKVEEIRKINDIKNIFTFKSKANNLSAESITQLLITLANDYAFLIAPSGTFSKNFIPRLGGVLDVQPITDIIKIHNQDTFDRPIYAGNAIATVKSKDKIKIITIRGTAFQPVAYENGNANIKTLPDILENKISKFISTEVSKSERPELSAAKVIISGGRGLGSRENFSLIESLADKIGAAIGASRAAVDAGYISNDYQVGQTGKVVAPELYIAIGISGAIQHLAGMKDSKIIVAINKDEDAPIFQVADYGLVGDLFQTVPHLNKLL